jgi:DNA-directed RNA polymerase specialized sigma24 family protein
VPTTELMIAALTQHREAPGEHQIEEFWKAVGRYRADLYNLALALLMNSEDAEVVVQESLRVAFQ